MNKARQRQHSTAAVPACPLFPIPIASPYAPKGCSSADHWLPPRAARAPSSSCTACRRPSLHPFALASLTAPSSFYQQRGAREGGRAAPCACRGSGPRRSSLPAAVGAPAPQSGSCPPPPSIRPPCTVQPHTEGGGFSRVQTFSEPFILCM